MRRSKAPTDMKPRRRRAAFQSIATLILSAFEALRGREDDTSRGARAALRLALAELKNLEDAMPEGQL